MKDMEKIYGSFEKIYDFAFWVTTDEKRVYPLKAEENNKVFMHREYWDYDGLVEAAVRNSVARDYKEEFKKFHDLDTIDDRMFGKERIYFEYQTTDGKWVRLYVVVAERNDEGWIEILTFSGRDITDVKQKEINYEKALIDSMQEAKKANEAKTSFLSQLSHDIRTPMNAIMGYSELLIRNSEDPRKVLDYTDRIRFSGDQLLNIINDVLDMTKIESGKIDVNLREARLSDLISSVYDMILPQAQKAGLEALIHTKTLDEDVFLMDDIRLSQVIANLLENALKYTEKGNISVEISMSHTDNPSMRNICFTVSDTGCGMSEEFMHRMFEPFAREKRESMGNIPGTGLGLAICRNLMDIMGGSITAESFLYEGSTFRVSLPVRIYERKLDDKDAFLNTGIRRIIIADADIIECENVREMMENLNVDVDFATTEIEFTDRLKKSIESGEKYDVILINEDFVGKERQNIEKLSSFIKETGDMKVIVTAYEDSFIKENLDEAMKMGINAFLPKPFVPIRFMELMENLDRSKEGQEGLKYTLDGDYGCEDSYSIRGLKILAAEDNIINRELLNEILVTEGADTSMACNGLEALDMYLAEEESKYDLILMDVQMSVMDGLEASRRIRASGRKDSEDIPIIALTANAFYEDVLETARAGMNAHVAKPMDITELKKTIIQLTGKEETKAYA